MPTLGTTRIHFSFPDGAFGYDCVECGFRCCRGAGFGASQREFVALERLYPSLRYAVRPSVEFHQGMVHLADFRPGCFFLASDGNCDIHTKHGRDAKPVVCKTFPANMYQFAGHDMTVSLNFFCPLKLWEPGASGVRIHHADLMADLEVSLDAVSPSQPIVGEATKHFRTWADGELDYEDWCRDAAWEHCGDDVLAAASVFALTLEEFRHPAVPTRPQIEGKREQLLCFARRVLRFLEADDDPAALALRSRELVALASRHRMILLQTRLRESVHDVLEAFPRFMCVTYLYAALMAKTNTTPLSLLFLQDFATQSMGMLYLLARLDDAPLFDEAAAGKPDHDASEPSEDVEARDHRVFLDFVRTENATRRWSLDRILEHLGIEPRRKLLLLHRLGFTKPPLTFAVAQRA